MSISGASGRRLRSSLGGPVISAVAAGVLAGGGLLGLAASPASASPLPACGAPVISAGTATVTCLYTGAAQFFTVPAGVTQATSSVVPPTSARSVPLHEAIR